MSDPRLPANALFLAACFIAAVAQIWLKESALKTHPNRLAEILNIRVAAAYALMLLATLINAWTLRWLDYKWSVVLGSAAYIFVLLLSRRRFGETLGPAARRGAALILAGLVIFTLPWSCAG